MGARCGSQILIVCHGRDRGREVATGKVFLDRLQKMDPELARRIRIHRTGQPQPQLADCCIVLFWLGDPLMQLYPACFAEAVAIAREARSRQIPVLNSPWALSNTLKSAQSDIWQAAGIPCARAFRVQDHAQLRDALDALGCPCLLRSDAAHAQRDVLKIDQNTRLSDHEVDRHLPGVLLEEIDVRAAYRQAPGAGPSVFSRYHHKARAFVFRDEVKASHLMFSPSLVVGVSSSVFAAQSRPLPRIARKLGFYSSSVSELVGHDLAYFAAPATGEAILTKAVRALGLDFAAVDYAIRPDGQLVMWEANPFFYLPEGSASVMFRERDAVRRVSESLDWMANCLRNTLSAQILEPATPFSDGRFSTGEGI